MPTIYSLQTGIAHEVSDETFESLVSGEWERGAELYATAPPAETRP